MVGISTMVLFKQNFQQAFECNLEFQEPSKWVGEWVSKYVSKKSDYFTTLPLARVV